MKKLVITLTILFQGLLSIAQEGYISNTEQQQDYLKLKTFLAAQKFNRKLFEQQFDQWMRASKKRAFASAVLVNDRHLIQTMPLNYDAKDLSWISPSKRYTYRDSYEYNNMSFGEQLTQDIMSDLGNNMLKNIGKKKYHSRYNAAENRKPYNTPSFLKF